MANKGYSYQYETSPRKLEPDYRNPPKKKKDKSSSGKEKTSEESGSTENQKKV